eukprot:scpid66923/ scgid2328/ 
MCCTTLKRSCLFVFELFSEITEDKRSSRASHSDGPSKQQKERMEILKAMVEINFQQCLVVDGPSKQQKERMEILKAMVEINFQQCLVVSPDTDTFHIGLPLLTNQTIFAQLDMSGSQEHSFTSVKSLSSSFTTDPDLQCIPENLKALTVQVTFIATGCDKY